MRGLKRKHDIYLVREMKRERETERDRDRETEQESERKSKRNRQIARERKGQDTKGKTTHSIHEKYKWTKDY
jgi:hypothetical protein